MSQNTDQQSGKRELAIVLLIALVLRVGLIVWQGDQLLHDRDLYLGIAQKLAAGEGFVHPETGQPTAYRPPLYPFVLASCVWLDGGRWSIGIVQILMGLATVWLTWALARRLGLGRSSAMAAMLVAADPILLRYTALPMTEVTSALLTTALFVVTYRSFDSATGSIHRGYAALAGLLFALCALCRPTILAFGPFGFIWLITAFAMTAGHAGSTPVDSAGKPIPTSSDRRPTIGGVFHCVRLFFIGLFSRKTLFAGALVLVVAEAAMMPWIVRNATVFGRLIPATTHGGYTLHLANNAVFYNSVVNKPWGAVWPGDSLRTWQQSLETAMQTENPPVVGEVARDGWMYRHAFRAMVGEPDMFMRSCWLRFRRFWNIVPLVDELPQPIRWSIGLFYAIVGILAVIGIMRALNRTWFLWFPALSLLATFSAVHTLYWSNMRMRAPLMPVIAVLATHALSRCIPSRGKQKNDDVS